MTDSSKSLGQEGEDLARDHLINLGYKHLDSNFRLNFGEIDLIFRDNKTIVFVEVKTRKNFSQGLPQEAVTPRKLRTIEKVGEFYLAKNNLSSSPARIDVIAIDLTREPPLITHIPNASQ